MVLFSCCRLRSFVRVLTTMFLVVLSCLWLVAGCLRCFVVCSGLIGGGWLFYWLLAVYLLFIPDLYLFVVLERCVLVLRGCCLFFVCFCWMF